jgi:hypothetical protein
VTFIVRNQPSGAVHVQRSEVQLPRAELAGIKGDLQAFLALPQRLIGLPAQPDHLQVRPDAGQQLTGADRLANCDCVIIFLKGYSS